MERRGTLTAVAPLIILLGLFVGIIPFVGPLFDFGMGPEPGWVTTTSRFVRHVIPAAAIVIGAFMLMPRARSWRTAGASLAVLGAIWLTIAPIVLGRPGEGVPALIDIMRPLVYHFGTGVIIATLAGYAAGRLLPRRERTTPVPARADRSEEQHAA